MNTECKIVASLISAVIVLLLYAILVVNEAELKQTCIAQQNYTFEACMLLVTE